MAKETNTEVAKTQPEIQLPEGLDLEQLKSDAAHNPHMDTNDVALPFLSLLQTNSPEVNPGHSLYIEGAQASMFMNTVTREVFNGRTEGLIIVPCYYERKLVEWIDRDKGGGWVADYPVDHPIQRTTTKNDKKKDVLPNGNFLVETAYQYVLFLNPDTGAWSQAVIGMKSTALKSNRQLNNAIAASTIPGTDLQAPRYLFPYLMRAEFEQKGENSWWNYSFKRMDEPVNSLVYKAARGFAELIRNGLIQRSSGEEDGGIAAGGTQIEGRADRGFDDGIPF